MDFGFYLRRKPGGQCLIRVVVVVVVVVVVLVLVLG